MTRPQIVVLVVAAVVVAALWAGFYAVTYVFVDDTISRTDPDPPGIDTLDRASVERLARITLPADASDLHTKYAEGIDYSLQLCFRTSPGAVPGFLSASALPSPVGAAPSRWSPGPGCPAPIEVRSSDQVQTGPVFRRVLVGTGPDGSAVVYLTAFTT